MLRNFLVAVSMLLLLATAVSCGRDSGEADVDGSPVLHIPDRSISVGRIPLEPRDVEIAIHNHGTADLKINGLETSCGCTDADVAESIVPPGQATTLTARITPRQPEERAARITVHTNDPNRPRVAVSLSWKAVGPVSIEPLFIDFGTIRPHKCNTTTLKIAYEVDEDNTRLCRHAIAVCRPSGPVYARKISEDVAKRRIVESWEIGLDTNTDTSVSQAKVVFEFDGCDAKEIVVPIDWEIADEIELSPSRIFLGSGGSGRNIEAIAQLTCEEGSTLQIGEVRWAGEAFHLDVSHRNLSESRVDILISGEGPSNPGLIKDELSVWCTRPVEREVRLPVSAFVIAE